jgi:hypothetical protein
MSWLPGWNTISGAQTWESAFFWGSIIALILLGIMEVASHRAAQRKDELTEQQQTETQRQHDEEMARLHVALAEASTIASKAGERAANAELALAKFGAPRKIDDEAAFLAAIQDAPKPIWFRVLYVKDDAESQSFALSRR